MSNPPVHNTRRPRRIQKVFRGKSLTQGSDQKEADIHYIMRQIERGTREFNVAHEGKYGDFSGSIDLQAAKNIITAAESMWEEVPSSIRKQFANDSGLFVDFMTDDKNFDAIEDMGLDNAHLTDPTPPPPDEPLIVPDPIEEPIPAPQPD